MDWAKTTARGYKKHLSFGATYTRGFTVSLNDQCILLHMQPVNLGFPQYAGSSAQLYEDG